ncbi:MAG: hypothetical protein HYU53_12895 [Acidobacteria bacterium]|nr:hypothetical protein [Acidobacteriota bacterium]
MTVRLSQWRGALPRAVLLAAAVTLIPLPVLADASQPAPQTIRGSIAKVVAREVAASSPARAAGQERGAADTSQLETRSFFKTPAGIICLAVVGAGTAYALYAAKNDRIHSVARK